MSPYSVAFVLSARITGSFRISLLGSMAVHLLALTLWTSAPPSGMPGGAVLQVTLVSGDVATPGSTPSQAASPSEPMVAPVEDPSALIGEAETMTASEPPASVASEQHREIMAVAGGDSPPVGSAQANRRHTESEPRARGIAEPRRGRPAEPKEPAAKPTRRPDQVADTQERALEHVAAAGSAPEGVRNEKVRSSGASPAEGEGGGAGGETYQALQAALHEALLPRLDYPLLARRRGWEGRVRVGLIVEPDGDLRDVHVVESSGFKVLDRAAVKDLKEVGTLTAGNNWLGDEEMDVTLPVQYRLR